jgi:phage nucleotide-binding protein
MAIQLKSTKGIHASGVKMLVYGASGAGKTHLISTMPNPVIFSAEGGLLSISDKDIPFIEINDMLSLTEAYQWLMGSDEAKQFDSIALDSISEIAEVVLSAEKKRTANGKLVDPRQAYGQMQEQMGDLIRSFRDIPNKNVYFSAKLEKSADEMGKVFYAPSMPGNKMAQSMPFYFDLVMALRVEKDAEGVAQRALMCDTDGIWLAKDRSGKLDAWEAPDIGAIIAKIGGAA